MRRLLAAMLLPVLMLPALAHAEFDFFSKPEELKGQTIVDAGTPQNLAGFDDPANIGVKAFMLGSTCFRTHDMDIRSDQTALLISGPPGTTRLATFAPTFGSTISLKFADVTVVKCGAAIGEVGNETIQKLQEQIRKNQEMARKLKAQAAQ